MYQALYRKWRPRTFDDVVGQSHITETLKNQVASDRLSHAYLFIGTRGTGKTTCAKILAKAVNCENPVNGNPCNCCRICRGIDDGSIMDVVEMDAASNNGVDNVRQLRDEAIFSPATAKKRVYIVDEVHMLSASAFNALLKILEEPPAHLMFILATTELNKVPATILSRCQRHSFKRLDTASIVGRLQYVAGEEQINLTPEAAALIAGLSEGGMRDALSMLDQCSGREKIDVETVYSAIGLAGNREIAEMLRHIAAHDTASAVSLFSRLWQNGKDPATLLSELSTLERDILMRTVAPQGGRELLSGGYDEVLLDGFKAAFPVAALVNHIGLIQSALADMRTGQARTVCELCLITLCEPELGDTLPALRERVALLEQRLANGVPAAASIPECKIEAAPVPQQTIPTPAAEVPFDIPVLAAPVPVQPTPAAEPEPIPEPAATSPTPTVPTDGDLWAQMQPDIGKVFPIGTSMMLSDPSAISGALRDDTLTLSVKTEFAMNMLDTPETKQKLSAIAAKLRSRETQVRFVLASADSTAAPAADKLGELGRFGVVKFQ